MKSRKLWIWSVGMTLTVLPLAGGCLQQSNNPPPVAATTLQSPAAVASATPTVTEVTLLTNAPATSNLVDAAVTPVSAPKALPASLRMDGPTKEVIRLANSGVEEGVILAFVTNSTSAFNLGVDEIIYLNDIGVPGSVVTAMLQHDQALKSLSTVPPNYAVAAPEPAPVPPAGPSPAEVAPQQDTSYVNANPELEAPPAPPAEPVTYGTFYDSLAPYGTWVEVAGYGRCWQPTAVVVNPGWRPYFDCGRWVYSDAGWYWLSDYSWGWAPFHYGRWFCHNRIGWVWAPDVVWGPSWVSWRYSDAYCGWAPLPPAACYRAGFGFTYYGSAVGIGFEFGIPMSCYSFVGWGSFCGHHLERHAVPHDRVAVVYNRTTVANRYGGGRHTVINHGVPPERVAAASRTEVQRVTLRETSTTSVRSGRLERLGSDGRTLSVYRPQISPSTTASSTMAERSRTDVRRPNNPAASTSSSFGSTTIRNPAAIGQPRAQREVLPANRPTSSPGASAPTTTTSTPSGTRNDPDLATGSTRSQTPATPANPAGQIKPGQRATATESRTMQPDRGTRMGNPIIISGRKEPAPGATATVPATQTAPQPSPGPTTPRTTQPRASDRSMFGNSPGNSLLRNANPKTVAEVENRSQSPTWAAPSAPATPRFERPAGNQIESPKTSGTDNRSGAGGVTAPPPSVPAQREFSTPRYQAPTRATPDAPQAAPASPAQSYSAPRSAAADSRPASPAPSSPAPSSRGGSGGSSRGQR